MNGAPDGRHPDARLAPFDALPAATGRATTLAALGKVLAGPDAGEGARVARILFAGVLGLELVQIIASPDAPLSGDERARLRAAAARCLAGESPGRVLGRRAFWGMEFRLGPHTLEPRPDTETLVETALDRMREQGVTGPLRLLDLGAGTGCILIALLSELPEAFGVGVDLAAGAAAIARDNAAANGIGGRCGFVAGDWAGALATERFDLVVSNPPYIESHALAGLDATVRLHDPVLALDGGPDGLAPYRLLAPQAMRLLRPGGVAAFEVGVGQAADVAALARAAGFAATRVTQDLAGVMRVVSGVKP